MTFRYIQRSLEPVLKRAEREFPAVILTGPRQSGKTTLLKNLFGNKYAYISLEPPDIRLAASEDPRGFLEKFAPPVIFDEVQYAPDLLFYIKERIDTNRQKAGQYLLTGSQNLQLMQRASESLAGRAATLRLLPLSRREISANPRSRFLWEKRSKTPGEITISARNLWETLLRGGYPEIVTNPQRDSNLWHSSYIQTYLERDVRSLRQIGELTQFQIFLKALAARAGQLLNITEVSRDLGVAVNTVKAWLSILEATFQIILLRPYFANIGKRLVKTPKIFFTDTGTLCHLVGLRDPEHASSGPMAGAIFETAVLSEIFKTIVHRGEEPNIYFWRTASGTEVDFILEREGKLIPIEVKHTATPRPAMGDGVRAFQTDMGGKASKGWLIYPGDMDIPLGTGVEAMPFGLL